MTVMDEAVKNKVSGQYGSVVDRSLIFTFNSMSDHSSSQGDEQEERWDDWIEEAQPSHSLFDEQIFASAELALTHDKSVHGVDLALLCTTLGKLSRVQDPGAVIVDRLDLTNSCWLFFFRSSQTSLSVSA